MEPESVTFLFTDVEGSSRLWELEPEAMLLAIKAHDSLLSSIFKETGGEVFKTLGDAFCVAYRSPQQAARAAVAVQTKLPQAAWPKAMHLEDSDWVALKVRIAILSGQAEKIGNDYFGRSLNRVSRLMNIGHGGQVLCSQEVVRETAGDPNLVWTDLGEHRLKDLLRPLRVYQLSWPGMPEEFPPLKSLASSNSNLPEQLAPLISREAELEMCSSLLKSRRLLTLTGAGGVGKTRLSLQIAADQMDAFPDGVWLVELAPLNSPDQIATAACHALSIPPPKDGSGVDALISHLENRKCLLIFDNCEHVIQGAAKVVDRVLKAAPGLTVLATSREPLGVNGEQRYHVPSLSLPARNAAFDEVVASEAVRFFCDRALLVRPDFKPTPETAPVLVEICHRLDGIPLAMELAAARLKSMSLPQMLERLSNRLNLLTGGSRSALPRQQTLRAAIDWSFDLLSPQEKVALRRLATFAGSWTLDSAEAVLEGNGIDLYDVLDLLSSLVDKSLVNFNDENRYSFLETIREFALEQLMESEDEIPCLSLCEIFGAKFCELNGVDLETRLG
jgi:predicted ATPase/class 3 adenylate cyclase